MSYVNVSSKSKEVYAGLRHEWRKVAHYYEFCVHFNKFSVLEISYSHYILFGSESKILSKLRERKIPQVMWSRKTGEKEPTSSSSSLFIQLCCFTPWPTERITQLLTPLSISTSFFLRFFFFFNYLLSFF